MSVFDGFEKAFPAAFKEFVLIGVGSLLPILVALLAHKSPFFLEPLNFLLAMIFIAWPPTTTFGKIAFHAFLSGAFSLRLIQFIAYEILSGPQAQTNANDPFVQYLMNLWWQPTGFDTLLIFIAYLVLIWIVEWRAQKERARRTLPTSTP